MVDVVRTVCRASLVAGLLAVVGCGPGAVDRPHDVVPVSGVVSYQGQPVEGATVTFHPVGDGAPPGVGPGKPSARARTDAQGRFRLWTYDHDDGAVPGEHVVTIVKTEIEAPDVDSDAEDFDPDTAPPTRVEYVIPERYSNRATSGLRETVTEEGPNEFEFVLEG